MNTDISYEEKASRFLKKAIVGLICALFPVLYFVDTGFGVFKPAKPEVNDRIPPAIFVGPSLLLVICRKFVVNCLSKTFTMA